MEKFELFLSVDAEGNSAVSLDDVGLIITARELRDGDRITITASDKIED
jgi:hypothetical protein